MDAVHEGKSFSNSDTPTTAVAINAIGRRQQLAPIIAATRSVAAGSRSADLESGLSSAAPFIAVDALLRGEFSQDGCSARRMQLDFHHGLLG